MSSQLQTFLDLSHISIQRQVNQKVYFVPRLTINSPGENFFRDSKNETFKFDDPVMLSAKERTANVLK